MSAATSRKIERPLSDVVFGFSDPVIRAFRVGGFGLAFLILGAFLMLSAFVRNTRDPLTYVIAGTGFFLMLLAAALFLFKDIMPLYRAKQNIDQKREIVDAIQRTALQMIEVTSDLQALAFKHATAAIAVSNKIRPIIRNVSPFIGGLADNQAMRRVDLLSATIVDWTTKIKTTIAEIEDALIRSDPKLLNRYLSTLKDLRVEIEGSLKG